jgi:phage tail-like protein
VNREDIEGLLPGNFRRAIRPEGPLPALLDVMAAMHAPAEAALAGLDRAFDCRRTAGDLVPYLARWVDLGPLLDRLRDELGEGEFPSGTGRLRDLVGLAAEFSRWRGTRRGLVAYLEVATGIRGFDVEEHADGRPFHLRCTAPPGAERHRALVQSVVEQEKPAYATYEIAFSSHEPGGR